MDAEQRLDLWQSWYQWARGEFGSDEVVVYAAALAAMRELDAGAGSARAAAVARGLAQMMAIARSQVPEQPSELSHVDYVLADLKKLDSETLPAAARDALVRRYQRRRQKLARAAGTTVSPATAATAPATRAIAATDAAPATAPAQPAGRGVSGWVDEQGILVLSYIGAFLLVVATLLFEIYGPRGMSGTLKFLGVLALNLAFGGLGLVSLSYRRLRVVGRTYIAIFALMAPLVVVAAYEFLLLREHGVSAESALFFGAAYCALLYGLLATRLGSIAYAWLSLVAVPVAAYGLVATIGLEKWAPVALAVVCVLYLAASFAPAGSRAALFQEPAKVLPAVVAALAIIAAIGLAGFEASQELDGIRYPYLPITFFLLAAAAAGHSVRWGARWLNWAVPANLTFGAIAANFSLRGDGNSAVLALLALAYVYAIAARPAGRWQMTIFFRVAAAVLALACATADFHTSGTQAAVLLAAAGVGLVLAFDTRQPVWLLVAVALFSDGWYWLVKAVVPPPPNPGPDTLALVLSPLPVLYAGIGIGLRAGLGPDRRRPWALPIYAGGAAVALLAIMLAASNVANSIFLSRTHADDTLVGWLILGYALLTYVVGAIEDEPVTAPVGAGGVALGVVVLFSRLDFTTATYPLALTAVAVSTYAGRLAWAGRGKKATAWVELHRWSGLALAGMTALYGFAPDLSRPHTAAVLSSMVPIVALAAMVYLEGVRFGFRHADLVAVLVLSFLGGRLATYAGLENVQFHVAAVGVALVATGRVLLQRDREQRLVAQLGIGAGAALLLLTTFAQAVPVRQDASLYTGLLVVESVAAIVVGVWWRNRVLVTLGGVGVALAALRAFFQVVQVIPLFAIFGGIALVVLVVAAALALARERLIGVGSGVRGTWREWD